MENVLVLNANYEPINVCNMRRAVCLMIMDKASLVQNGRGLIHTISDTFPMPSVIRLEKMVHKPRPRVKMTRKEVFRRDHFTCQYCGSQSRDLTIDHINPKHLGGTHSWTNVVTACSYCNHKKGGRPLDQTGMALLKNPSEPPASAAYIFDHFINLYEDWEPFIKGW
jgi:5-methylcytosine-specific restriction endonuclease McrA